MVYRSQGIKSYLNGIIFYSILIIATAFGIIMNFSRVDSDASLNVSLEKFFSQLKVLGTGFLEATPWAFPAFLAAIFACYALCVAVKFAKHENEENIHETTLQAAYFAQFIQSLCLSWIIIAVFGAYENKEIIQKIFPLIFFISVAILPSMAIHKFLLENLSKKLDYLKTEKKRLIKNITNLTEQGIPTPKKKQELAEIKKYINKLTIRPLLAQSISLLVIFAIYTLIFIPTSYSAVILTILMITFTNLIFMLDRFMKQTTQDINIFFIKIINYFMKIAKTIMLILFLLAASLILTNDNYSKHSIFLGILLSCLLIASLLPFWSNTFHTKDNLSTRFTRFTCAATADKIALANLYLAQHKNNAALENINTLIANKHQDG